MSAVVVTEEDRRKTGGGMVQSSTICRRMGAKRRAGVPAFLHSGKASM